PKDVYNFYYSSFVYNDAIYLARNNENNIGIISFPPYPDLKTPNCFAEKYIVIDSNNYAYQESLDLFHLIKEKEGNAINLIDVITADDNLLYLYTDGTEEGKAKARLNAINKLGRELGGIDLYIYLNANEENNKKLLLNYYPYSDSEELANNLKTNLLTSINLDAGSVILPPELKYDFLIHKSNLLSSAISINYSFTRRDRPLLMDNILKSIKDYLPQDSEQANFKLCVNTKSQLLTYNQVTDQVENNDIIIRFGLKIE
ncbi:MAG: hypothetical protein QGH19_02870, partial [Candidatus Woesearchaeota archaeon]|nr:hypothetical protein [Candidatus Woesearchaeota archaeon]